jgi:hypothetical protein
VRTAYFLSADPTHSFFNPIFLFPACAHSFGFYEYRNIAHAIAAAVYAESNCQCVC